MTAADVIITVTSSNQPLLMADHVTPGTYVVAMGADTIGKQEIDPKLFSNAAVFTDEVAQSLTIGEAQYAVAAGFVDTDAIVPIGRVVNGDHAGRTNERQITIFDGAGVGLQDLALASVGMRHLMRERRQELPSRQNRTLKRAGKPAIALLAI